MREFVQLVKLALILWAFPIRRMYTYHKHNEHFNLTHNVSSLQS